MNNRLEAADLPEITGSPARAGVSKVALPLVVAILCALLYLPVLIPLARQWINDPNYQHGVVVPIVSAALLWRQRAALRAARPGGGSAAGVLFLVIASILLVGGTAASELFTARLSLPIMLIGLLLVLRGREFVSRALFPLLFLFLMVPLPYIIYYKFTFPMQIMSARLSSGLLRVLQIEVIRRGNTLILPNYTLEVIAACSGLRSLMTMFALAVILCAFSRLSTPGKVILALSSLPIAVAANTVRLAVTALGALAVGPSFADGTLHEISGLIVFFTGFIMLLAMLGILKWTERKREPSSLS